VADGDPPSLFLYSLAERRAVAVAHTENARSPFFSPDGRWIGFATSDGFLKRVSIDGGAPITIGKTGEIRGAAWGDDDQIVFGAKWSPLKLISARNGSISVLPLQNPPGLDSRWPVFLPGGKRILYTAFDMSGDYDNAQLAVFDLETSRTTTVLRGATYGRFLAPDQLVYFRSGTLFSVPFDAGALRVTGEPSPRVSDVDDAFGSGLAHFAIASDGTLFYVPRDPAASDGELVWVTRHGDVTLIGNGRRAFYQPRLSPDGSRILVTLGDGPNAVLWVYDIGRQTWSRLAPIISTGIWSSDGKDVAFSSNRNGPVNIFVASADGSTPPRQITHTTHWPFASSWSADGRELAIVEQFKETLVDIYIVAASGGEARPFVASPFNESDAVFSPNGSWLAYESDESGRSEIYVTPYPQGGRRWLVSRDGGVHPEWRRDGKELFYLNGKRVMAVDVNAGADFSTGKPRVLFEGEFSGLDVAIDGSKFLMVKRDPPAPRTQINVVSGLR
jgi:serine/threonine-protein kinase